MLTQQKLADASDFFGLEVNANIAFMGIVTEEMDETADILSVSRPTMARHRTELIQEE